MTGDFAKELQEYRKFQKERRRSKSRLINSQKSRSQIGGGILA